MNNNKSLHELNLSDDFLFCKVMSDPEICRITLEKILDIPIKNVGYPTTQKTIDVLLESKGIRLDIYAFDDKGSFYCCEMQTGKRRQLPRRSRYYHASLDLDLITKGEPYENLAKTIVIFVCTFDPFKKGRHIYTFERICKEDQDILLGDDTITIFLNTKGTANDVNAELLEFLSYVENTTDDFADQAESEWIKKLHDRVTDVRLSKEMEVEYLTLLQRDRENIEQGKEQGMAEGVKKMATLTDLLLNDGRTDDLKRATKDDVYRDVLFTQYNI